MKFKQLPKDKRNHLILVVIVTIITIGGIGYGLVRLQYDNLKKIARDTEAANKKLSQMHDTIKKGDQIETELQESSKALGSVEEGMATGDLYSWVFENIRRFKLAYKVEIPSISQPLVADTTLLPKFPYKQATLTLAGSGYYHDIGRFVSDFENQFPYIRVVNLTLDPVNVLVGDEREKLEFKMDIVTLVRPNNS